MTAPFSASNDDVESTSSPQSASTSEEAGSGNIKGVFGSTSNAVVEFKLRCEINFLGSLLSIFSHFKALFFL